jgi:hypothetical protein
LTVTGDLRAAGSCAGIGFGAEDSELDVDEGTVVEDTACDEVVGAAVVETEPDVGEVTGQVTAVENAMLKKDNGIVVAVTPCVGNEGAAFGATMCDQDEDDGTVNGAHQFGLGATTGAGPNAV